MMMSEAEKQPRQYQGRRYGGQPAPQEAEYERKFQEESQKITQVKESLDNCYSMIEQVKSQRLNWTTMFSQAEEGVQLIQTKIQNLLEERNNVSNAIQEKINDSTTQKTAEENYRRDLKKNIDTVEKTDELIKEIDNYMMTSTLSREEHKAVWNRLVQLRAQKQRALKSAEGMKAPHSSSSGLEGQDLRGLKKRLTAIDSEIADLRTQRNEAQSKFPSNANRIQNNEKIKGLFQERDSLKQQLKEHIAVRSKILEDKKEYLMKHREQMELEHQKKWNRMKEEDSKQKIETQKIQLQAKLEKAQEHPLTEEVALLEKLVNHLRKLIDDRKKSGDMKKALSRDVDGDVSNQSSSHRLSEGEGAFRSGKGKKKDKSKHLRFDHQILQHFFQCGVDIPITDADLENALRDLEGKLIDQKTLQKAELEKREAVQKDLLGQIAALTANSIAT